MQAFRVRLGIRGRVRRFRAQGCRRESAAGENRDDQDEQQWKKTAHLNQGKRQQPSASRRLRRRGSGAHNGRVRRAYQSAFCRDDKSEIREFRSATARRDPLFHLYGDLLCKTVLDEIAFGSEYALVRPGQRNRFVVM